MSTPPDRAFPCTAAGTGEGAASSTIKRVLLTGYMGAGKSTIGRALARNLGWSFVDVDEVVEEKAGCSIVELFAIKGEVGFRREESRALVRALGRNETIIAIGGGAPEILTNRLLIEQTPGTCVLLLTADFPVLYDRCALQSLEAGVAERPNLADPVAAQLRYQQRMPFYRRLANLTLETAALSPAETVTEALSLLLPRLAITAAAANRS